MGQVRVAMGQVKSARKGHDGTSHVVYTLGEGPLITSHFSYSPEIAWPISFFRVLLQEHGLFERYCPFWTNMHSRLLCCVIH